MAKKNTAENESAQATDTDVAIADTPSTDNGLGHAEYKLAGDIAEELKGKLIKTKDCGGDLNRMHLLVQDGKSEHVARLAQAQYDIIVQRAIRNYATSDEVRDILAGKADVEIDGTKLDFSGMSAEDRVAYVIGRIQEVADEYQYGSRPLLGGGGTKALKEKVTKLTEDKAKLASAAAADPELAAKLAALGYTL